MTISTNLLFSRAVEQMGQQKTKMSELQEQVSTGRKLVRPSDAPELAVNLARIKSSISQLDAYKDSLNSVNDRLRLEESYVGGTKDLMIRIRELIIQGSNASMSGKDREILALEVDELIAGVQNMANGTDINGNFVFGGSRVSDRPFVADEDDVIQYKGDSFQSQIDYTSSRRSPIGRSGVDVFKPVLTGEQIDPIPGIYEISTGGSIEYGDSYFIEIDGNSFSYDVQAGDDRVDILTNLAAEVRKAVNEGSLKDLDVGVSDNQLRIISIDGTARRISAATQNTSEMPIADLNVTSQNDEDSDAILLILSGTPQAGDAVRLTVGSRSYTYNFDESDVDREMADLSQKIVTSLNESRLFSSSAVFSVSPTNTNIISLNPIRDRIGVVEYAAFERTNINNQEITVLQVQEPTPAIPERVGFFESLQEASKFLRIGSQNQIQGKIDHLDQMLDTVTLSMADIGAEMRSITDEITINEDLKLQMETTLSAEEDIDFTKAITELQAKLMSLEAAQSSFAKISQLSVFDYIR